MINSILKYIKINVKSNISVLFLFSLLTFLVFHPVLSNGFMGDDSGQIVSNIYIRSLRNIPLLLRGGTFYVGGIEDKLFSDYYRPMMIIWYSLLYSLFGLNAFYYHLFQIILHIINGLLVFLLFRKFLSGKLLPLFLSLIFLLHPIQTETVAYLATVQDLLFFFFGACGLYFFVNRKHPAKSLFLILFFFFLAMLSKEVAVVFFIITIVYMDIFKVSQKIYRLFWLGSVLVVALYVYARCFVAHICTLGGGGHSVVPIARLSLSERVQQIPAMVFFYLKTFLYPKDLATFQYWLAKKNLYGLYLPLAIDLLIFAILIAVPFYFFIKKQSLPSYVKKKWFGNNTSLAQTYVFFLFWLLVGIAVYINIIPLDSTVAERWFYFPLVGLLGTLGVFLSLIQKKTKIYVVLTVILILFAIRSYVRSLDWSDPYKLYSHDIQISKNSASLENNYGAVLFDKGDYKNAEIHFRNAIKLAPQSPIYLSNMAQIYEKRKDYKNAEKYYLKSIKYGRFYVAFERYANLLIKQGKKKEAKQFLKEKALNTFPYNKDIQALYNRL